MLRSIIAGFLITLLQPAALAAGDAQSKQDKKIQDTARERPTPTSGSGHADVITWPCPKSEHVS